MLLFVVFLMILIVDVVFWFDCIYVVIFENIDYFVVIVDFNFVKWMVKGKKLMNYYGVVYLFQFNYIVMIVGFIFGVIDDFVYNFLQQNFVDFLEIVGVFWKLYNENYMVLFNVCNLVVIIGFVVCLNQIKKMIKIILYVCKYNFFVFFMDIQGSVF